MLNIWQFFSFLINRFFANFISSLSFIDMKYCGLATNSEFRSQLLFSLLRILQGYKLWFIKTWLIFKANFFIFFLKLMIEGALPIKNVEGTLALQNWNQFVKLWHHSVVKNWLCSILLIRKSLNLMHWTVQISRLSGQYFFCRLLCVRSFKI